MCIWFHSCPFALDSQQKSSSKGNANLLPQQSSVGISSFIVLGPCKIPPFYVNMSTEIVIGIIFIFM